MKKRSTAAILVLCLIMTLIPVKVKAATDFSSLTIAGQTFSESNTIITCGSGTASLDTSSPKWELTLNNATITGDIICNLDNKLVINLQGNSIITGGIKATN